MPLLALSLALSLSVAMNADLAGSTWAPTELRGEPLAADQATAAARMFVEFKQGGEISGNGGCNHFFGAYAVSGSAISIGPIASTRKGCPGTMRLEASFFATLQAARTFASDDKTLVLFSAAGQKLAAFARAGAT